MRFLANDDFDLGVQLALGASYHRAADVGEVLMTAERIQDGDSDGWVREWLALADRCCALGRDAVKNGRRGSAVRLYRRAATYYATALCRIAASDACGRERELWRRQRACWDHVVDCGAVPGERLRIAYEGTTLPGYFFRAPDAQPRERRPLLVMNNGGHGATSQMWVEGGAGASERGYHWMTFDGPGQQAALYEQDLSFRSDWEAVLSPVLDALLARRDVDHDRVAVIGVGQAGYWIPRALAFEHRLAAAVVDPGVIDVLASWIAPLPQVMRNQLRDGQRAAFDREMQVVETLSPATAATLRYQGRPYGVGGDSRFDLYMAVSRYRLDGEEQHITTPLLITDPAHEPFWPGQSQQLHDRLSGERTLVKFNDHKAPGHRHGPVARGVRDARIFDWLDDHLQWPPNEAAIRRRARSAG
jgi:hypothetical protein